MVEEGKIATSGKKGLEGGKVSLRLQVVRFEFVG